LQKKLFSGPRKGGPKWTKIKGKKPWVLLWTKEKKAGMKKGIGHLKRKRRGMKRKKTNPSVKEH